MNSIKLEEINMPKLSFALEAGEKKRLDIVWIGTWKNVTIILDGNTVGTIPDQKTLFAGKEFSLPDGSRLRLELVKKLMSTDLHVLRTGLPVPGSASDPQISLTSAYALVYLIGGISLILGAVSFLFNVEFLQQIGIGLSSFLLGLVFLVLAFFIQRKSMVALVLAIAIFTLDSIAGIVLSVMQGYEPSIGGIILRIFLLIPMIQAIGALRAIKKANT